MLTQENLFIGSHKTNLTAVHKLKSKQWKSVSGLTLACSLLHSSIGARREQSTADLPESSGSSTCQGKIGSQVSKMHSSSFSRKHALLKGTLEISDRLRVCPGILPCLQQIQILSWYRKAPLDSAQHRRLRSSYSGAPGIWILKHGA